MVYFDNLGWHRDWLELQRAELQPEGHCGESATPVEKGEGLSEILPPLRYDLISEANLIPISVSTRVTASSKIRLKARIITITNGSS